MKSSILRISTPVNRPMPGPQTSAPKRMQHISHFTLQMPPSCQIQTPHTLPRAVPQCTEKTQIARRHPLRLSSQRLRNIYGPDVN